MEVERGRASYMVAEEGQQENGDRADAASGASHQHSTVTRSQQLGLQSLHIKKIVINLIAVLKNVPYRRRLSTSNLGERTA